MFMSCISRNCWGPTLVMQILLLNTFDTALHRQQPGQRGQPPVVQLAQVAPQFGRNGSIGDNKNRLDIIRRARSRQPFGERVAPPVSISSSPKSQQPHPVRYIMSEKQFGREKSDQHKFFVWHSPHPTLGEVWPQPWSMTQIRQQIYRVLNTAQHTGKPSLIVEGTVASKLNPSQQMPLKNAILEMAIERFRHKVTTLSGISTVRGEIDQEKRSTVMTKVDIRVKEHPKVEEWPHLFMSENYSIRMEPATQRIVIEANQIWGAMYGLETLSQLLFVDESMKLFMYHTSVTDCPRFPHRGLMIDTARRYIPLSILLRNLDAMVMNKLNVFHWHVVDDQSFPFRGPRMPEMADKGAFNPDMVYTPADVSALLQYARVRGIRVIPEFDTPSHTQSWGRSKNILTECHEQNGASSGFFGPMDPTLNETYNVLRELYLDLQSLFPDEYLHIGADEVDTACWNTNPQISAYLRQYDANSNTPSDLLSLFTEKLISIINQNSKSLNEKKRRFIVWQEAWEKKAPIPQSDLIIQFWFKSIPETLDVAKLGWKIIYSAGYYLDHKNYGADWVRFYQTDLEVSFPLDNNGDTEWQRNVLGGEACMWNEYNTAESMTNNIWPAAMAVAEKLWSRGPTQFNIESVAARLEEHRCRLLSSGIPVGVASGPGECFSLVVDNVSTSFNELLQKDLLNFLQKSVQSVYWNRNEPTRTTYSKLSIPFLIVILFLFVAVLYSRVCVAGVSYSLISCGAVTKYRTFVLKKWAALPRSITAISHRGALCIIVTIGCFSIWWFASYISYRGFII